MRKDKLLVLLNAAQQLTEITYYNLTKKMKTGLSDITIHRGLEELTALNIFGVKTVWRSNRKIVLYFKKRKFKQFYDYIKREVEDNERHNTIYKHEQHIEKA